MSLLRRTGTGRNNIDWYNASSNSSGKYLRRTSTGRNNISFIQISTSGTWNILNRTSTGRNNIVWKNTVFSFKTETETNADNFFNYLHTYGEYFKFRSITSSSSDYFGYRGSFIKNDGYYKFERNGSSVSRGSGAYGFIGVYCGTMSNKNTLVNLLNQLVNKKIFARTQRSEISTTYYNVTLTSIYKFDTIVDDNTNIGINMTYEGYDGSSSTLYSFYRTVEGYLYYN